MSVKQTTSVKTTTNLNTGSTKSFKTSYKTSSPTNIGKGGLSTLGRAGMITITIITISIGSSVRQFTIQDLNETTPNYQLKNQFVPIDDPLNTINYIQYGDEVFNNLWGFVQGFSAVGNSVKTYWDDVISFVESPALQTAVNFLTDFNRLFTNINDAQDIYDAMSGSNKVTYATFYDEITWFVKWVYYSPAELTA
jgi:hypothetical protein